MQGELSRGLNPVDRIARGFQKGPAVHQHFPSRSVIQHDVNPRGEALTRIRELPKISTGAPKSMHVFQHSVQPRQFLVNITSGCAQIRYIKQGTNDRRRLEQQSCKVQQSTPSNQTFDCWPLHCPSDINIMHSSRAFSRIQKVASPMHGQFSCRVHSTLGGHKCACANTSVDPSNLDSNKEVASELRKQSSNAGFENTFLLKGAYADMVDEAWCLASFS